MNCKLLLLLCSLPLYNVIGQRATASCRIACKNMRASRRAAVAAAGWCPQPAARTQFRNCSKKQKQWHNHFYNVQNHNSISEKTEGTSVVAMRIRCANTFTGFSLRRSANCGDVNSIQKQNARTHKNRMIQICNCHNCHCILSAGSHCIRFAAWCRCRQNAV